MYPIHYFVFYCFMITYCVFGAIKFYQLEVQCNFPVYLASCVKYKLILFWHTLQSKIFMVLRGFFKNQSRSFFYMISIETSSICKHFLSLWFGFLSYLIHFYWRTFFQQFVFLSYLIFLKVFMYQVRRILCN